jgi:quercetin dioxygenase-like cupin family protein
VTAVEPTDTSDRLIWTFNMLMDVKATAEETGGALSVIESWLTPDANPPLHIHHGEDEAILVLEGELDYYLGEGPVRHVGPGEFVFGPRDVPHRFEVLTPEAHTLVFGTPGGGERFFQALGVPAASRALPVPQEPDVEQVVSVAVAHDVEVLPPPA